MAEHLPTAEHKRYYGNYMSTDSPDGKQPDLDPYSSSLENDDEVPIASMDTPPRNYASPLPKRALIIGVVMIVVIIALLGMVSLKLKPAKKSPPTVVINTQTLDAGTLNKLTVQEGTTPAKQQLTITPDTLFKNSVEIQGSVKVAKNFDIGGNANLHGNLSVSGLITASSLSVGSLSINTINLSGNLNFGGHIVPTGSAPTAAPSVAASGGTVTISGNDSAGTITITIGNGSLLAGELAIITFHSAFSTTPKVQLTPINSASAALLHYATRSPKFFTINDIAPPPEAGTSYVFDYLITE